MWSEELRKIESRMKDLSPGPWKYEYLDRLGWDNHAIVDANNHIVTKIHYNPGDGEDDKGDCEFIAYAREDIPVLIAEVRRLMALVCSLAGEVGGRDEIR